MNNLTAEYKIKRHILRDMLDGEDVIIDGICVNLDVVAGIDIAWGMADDRLLTNGSEYDIDDYCEKFMWSGDVAGSSNSRVLSCGACVTWIKWNGEADRVKWMSDAFEVDNKDCTNVQH